MTKRSALTFRLADDGIGPIGIESEIALALSLLFYELGIGVRFGILILLLMQYMNWHGKMKCRHDCLVDCRHACLVDCRHDCLVDCWHACLVDCRCDCLVDCRRDYLVDCRHDCLVDCRHHRRCHHNGTLFINTRTCSAPSAVHLTSDALPYSSFDSHNICPHKEVLYCPLRG